MLAKILSDSVRYAFNGSITRCLTSIPDSLWPVIMDEWEVGNAFNCLLTNAHEAMPSGGMIEVSAQNVVAGYQYDYSLQPGKYVEVTIKDQGNGIPQKYLDKIFNPYFTTKLTSKGMGLAKVYSAIKNHGGHITVESQLGVGTVFCVYLPAAVI